MDTSSFHHHFSQCSKQKYALIQKYTEYTLSTLSGKLKNTQFQHSERGLIRLQGILTQDLLVALIRHLKSEAHMRLEITSKEELVLFTDCLVQNIDSIEEILDGEAAELSKAGVQTPNGVQ